MEGKGGLGFLMLDEDGNLKYASNAKDVCIPKSIGSDFTIYSLDVDGSLHEVAKVSGGEERVSLARAGQLSKNMSELAIKLILSGKINGTDIKFLRKLIAEGHLQSIDLMQAQIVSGGTAYYTKGDNSYSTTNNVMGNYAFQGFSKLIMMRLPQSITSIGSNAFSQTGLRIIDIPDKVTSVGEDAFAYCSQLSTVVIGKGIKSLSKGAFYDSKVKDVYVKALTPPNVSSYLFSSNPTIHVYASALEKYKASAWAEYGTIVGDLDDDFIDGIETIEHSTLTIEHSEDVYDISGRRVNNGQLPKGLYIVGGKKVAIK